MTDSVIDLCDRVITKNKILEEALISIRDQKQAVVGSSNPSIIDAYGDLISRMKLTAESALSNVANIRPTEEE